MAMRKTKLMRGVEERYNQPLEKLLPRMYNEMGLPRMAEALGVSRSTVWYWMLRYGVDLKKVALAPGETLETRTEKR
jgi:transcriptional regulator with PAS, ATPase and Fis domain